MSRKRKIKFDYVRVYSSNANLKDKGVEQSRPFNLEVILKEGMNKSVEQRTARYYGEEIRLQELNFDSKSGLWKLQFVRERAADVPGIIDKGTNEFKALPLEEDEYIGEQVTALYHSETKVMMIQRNRMALGIKGIEAFFNNTLKHDYRIIELKVVPFKSSLKELQKLKLRKIEVKFSEIIDYQDDSRSSLTSVLRGAEKMNSYSTTVSFSVGRAGKEKSLSAKEIEKFTQLTQEDGFNKVHLEYKVSEDSPLEIIEMIDGRLVDECVMEYSKGNRIEYTRVNVIMENLFKERLPYLLRIFNPKR